MVPQPAVADELQQVELYYDTVPRAGAVAEDHGSLTLFVSQGAFPYYARPRRGAVQAVTVESVDEVRARQRELGVPEAFEWIDDLNPELADAVTSSGMSVYHLPLMVHRVHRSVPPPPSVTVRMLEADDPTLPAVQAAIGLGFAAPGTVRGAVGDAQREAATDDIGHDDVRRRIAAGQTALAGAFAGAGPVAGGSHSRRADVAEITGVATLPAYRRRGIGAAVTAVLVEDARASGAEQVFLSAGSADIARVYERIGFERVGTACIAGIPAG